MYKCCRNFAVGVYKDPTKNVDLFLSFIEPEHLVSPTAPPFHSYRNAFSFSS